MAIVTVVLPNYNNEDFLNDAIDSILNQTFTDFDFIIIDDGSTDNSVDIINSYTDPRIKLILKQENSGIVDTLNIGLEKAKGKYLVRMDGDDISYPDRIEKLVNYLDNNPDIGVCSSALLNFGLIDEVWKYDQDPLINKAKVLFGNPFGHPTSVFRMSLLKENNIKYKNSYPFVEDYKLFTDLNSITLFSCLPDILYKYRRLPHTSTIANKETLKERIGLVYEEVLYQLLRREPTKIELDIHFDFYKGGFNGSLKSYFNWSKILIETNDLVKIYPKEELNQLINTKIEKILFRSLDKSKYNILIIFYHQRTIKIKYLKYIFRSLFKVN